MTEDNAIYILILKYIEGKANEEETITFLNWVNQSEENKTLYFQIKDIKETAARNNADLPTEEKVWKNIIEKYHAEGGAEKKGKKISKIMKYAAAVVLITGATLLFTQYRNSAKWITVRVEKNGTMKKVLLPDSTEVWLKPGSSIHYASNFNKENRVVDLKGDGFFEVARQLDELGNRRAFTIKTAQLNIRVLGTSFNVQHHGADESVVVSTGIVRVESHTLVKTLYPGDRVLLKGKQLISTKVNAELYKGWMNGEYKFNNTSIQEIQELLELSYNVKVEILQSQKFKNIHLSGRVFAKTEQEFLDLLKTMLPASVIKQENVITIKPLAYD